MPAANSSRPNCRRNSCRHQAGEGSLGALGTVATAFMTFLALHHLLQTRREHQAAQHITAAFAHGLPDSWKGAEREADRILKILFTSNRPELSRQNAKVLSAEWVRIPCAEQPSAGDTLKHRPSKRALALCKNHDQGATLHFWVQHHSSSAGKPKKSLHLKTSLERVASCSPSFCSTERKRWLLEVTQRWQSTFQSLSFRSRVAEGGPARAFPPYNLTRDCFFSPQGYECRSPTTRSPGKVARSFTDLRQASVALQFSLCAAEACIRVPHPSLCATSLIAAGATALSPTGQPPAQCPALAGVVRTAHSLARTALLAAVINQKRINLCLSARLSSGPRNGWLCPSSVGEATSVDATD